MSQIHGVCFPPLDHRFNVRKQCGGDYLYEIHSLAGPKPDHNQALLLILSVNFLQGTCKNVGLVQGLILALIRPSIRVAASTFFGYQCQNNAMLMLGLFLTPLGKAVPFFVLKNHSCHALVGVV